jgi:DGQHR domain-containing protein
MLAMRSTEPLRKPKTKERKKMSSITLPVLPLKQSGKRIFLTAMKAEDLPKYTQVDVFDASKPFDDPKQGYQRNAEPPRVKKFANWLRKTMENGGGALVPTSILLSSRNVDLHYNEKTHEITLSAKSKLHLVDGQHRTEGFHFAISEKGLEEAREMEMPVVIVEGLDRNAEMRQFSVVNGTQKSVRTDLVNMILTQLAVSEGDDAIQDNDLWKVVVSLVLEELNEDKKGPWNQMVVMPNETSFKKVDYESDPSLAHRKLVRATSFMTSLKPVYDYLDASFFDGLSAEERAEMLTLILSNFWAALKELNPEAFAKPGDYVIQKTPGLFALHRVCKRILPIMHMARREWDKKNFVAMLEPCEELRRADFWDAKTGDAARYGSMKGFAELADLLWESLKS